MSLPLSSPFLCSSEVQQDSLLSLFKASLLRYACPRNNDDSEATMRGSAPRTDRELICRVAQSRKNSTPLGTRTRTRPYSKRRKTKTSPRLLLILVLVPRRPFFSFSSVVNSYNENEPRGEHRMRRVREQQARDQKNITARLWMPVLSGLNVSVGFHCRLLPI